MEDLEGRTWVLGQMYLISRMSCAVIGWITMPTLRPIKT